MRVNYISNILIISLVTSFIADASTREPSAKRRRKRPAVTKASKEKPKTVGEVLKGISNQYRGKTVQITKYKIAVPDSKPVLTPPPGPKDLVAVKPPRSAEILRSDTKEEAEIERITDKSIQELYKITQKHRNSPNRGELWLRLAELYVEKAKLIEMRKREEFDKANEAYLAKKRKSKPRLDLGVAKDYNLKAIQLYEWFVKEFPKDKKIDQALFFLGYNYFELGNVQKGRYYYDRLSKEYKNSPYVNEADFALGEFYFDNEKFTDAIKHYQNVLRNKRARLYTLSQYKIGWCQYRMGKPKDAIRSLERVVLLSRQSTQQDQSTGRRSVNRLRLASEALKDLIVFYAEVGDPKAAPNYFKNIGGAKVLYAMLEKLAYRYSDLGKREAARYIFREVLDMRPTAPKAFDYQYQIMTNFAAGGDQKTFRNEMYTWISQYGPDTEWGRANSSNKELMKKANEQRESTLRNHVLAQHRSAQLTRSKYNQKVAADGYSVYIKFFNDSPNISEMRFFYGELLYDMKRFNEASQQYQWVADNGQKSKYQEMALINLLLSLEKDLPSDNELSKRIGKSLNKVEFGKAEKKFENAAKKYVDNFPKGEKVVDVKFKLARLYYAFNHLDEALALFKEIVEKHSNTQNAQYSANLILDIYNLRKDYDGLTKAAKEMMKVPALQRSGFAKEVKDVVEKAQFKKAQDTEASKDFLASAKSYEEFARNNSKSELALGAIYNAGLNYEKANQPLDAIRMYNQIIDSKDKGAVQFRQKSHKLMGRLYEITGQYEQAAREFESFAKAYPKDPSAVDFYYNAFIIRSGLNHYQSAQRNFDAFFSKSKKRDKVEALYLMAEMSEGRNALSLAINYYKQYLQSNPPNLSHIVIAHYKIADLSEKTRRHTQAKEYYKKTIGVYNRLKSRSKDISSWHAAESAFRLIEPLFNEFKSVRIPKSQKAQTNAVNRRLQLLNQLNIELAKVVKYDSADQIVAALTTVAQANENMASAILNSPAPSGLKADELETYRKELQKVADPFLKNAHENYQLAYRRGLELGAYTDWMLIAGQGLRKYDANAGANETESIPIDQSVDLMGI